MNSRVFVYESGHPEKIWSVKAIENKSVYHVREISLFCCEFKVDESVRQKVINDKQNYVHAGIEGTIVPLVNKRGRRIQYNPYLRGEFFFFDNKDAIFEAKLVNLRADKTVEVIEEGNIKDGLNNDSHSARNGTRDFAHPFIPSAPESQNSSDRGEQGSH